MNPGFSLADFQHLEDSFPPLVVEEISFYFARAKPNFVLKPKDKMRKEVASFKMIVNFKL